MAQDLVIAGATYEDVPSISVPKYGGGVADYVDTSDANATAEDIIKDKTAYVNGEKVIGTYEGGSATLITKNITANGTYNASSDNADGYSSVTVSVPSDMEKLLTGQATYIKSNSTFIPLVSWVHSNTNWLFNVRYYSFNKNTGLIPTSCLDCGSLRTELKMVNFGRPVSFEKWILYGQKYVKSVVMKTKTVIPLINIEDFEPIRNNGLLYIPDLDTDGNSLVNMYKSASSWSTCANNIRGFSEAPSYDANATYEIGDVCKYNGKFYDYCKADLTSSTGNAPSGTTEDNEYWEYVDDIEV